MELTERRVLMDNILSLLNINFMSVRLSTSARATSNREAFR